MAEKKGFLRRIFSFGSAREEERTPENGQTPRPNDVEVGREDAPDPDARPVAAAHTLADAEAGTTVEEPVVPVSEMGKESSGEANREKGVEADAAQKKTLSRSNWG